MSTDLTLNPDAGLVLTDDERQKVDSYKEKIDLNSTNTLIQYGVAAQNKLASFSEGVLRQVRTKDMGEPGEILADLSNKLRNFDDAVNKKSSFFGLFDNLKKRINRIQSEYAGVEKNIAGIGIRLEKYAQTLMKDINLFDHLYAENEGYFREISLYIIAGEEKIKEMHDVVLPQMKDEAEQSPDQQKAQAYRNMEQQVNRFEKKIHDLKLSRMISLQLAPQIRLVQNNSATLTDKIQSTIANTLPLWKNQMVLALGIVHSQQALEAQRTVTDATNRLLQKNSEMLKESTIQIAEESERGIVDMETIRKANTDLFTALDDLMRIQAEGRQKRLDAEAELVSAESELKNRLLANRPGV